jgi:hypothetical protein
VNASATGATERSFFTHPERLGFLTNPKWNVIKKKLEDGAPAADLRRENNAGAQERHGDSRFGQ